MLSADAAAGWQNEQVAAECEPCWCISVPADSWGKLLAGSIVVRLKQSAVSSSMHFLPMFQEQVYSQPQQELAGTSRTHSTSGVGSSSDDDVTLHKQCFIATKVASYEVAVAAVDDCTNQQLILCKKVSQRQLASRVAAG
jgi:hypothetical protein